PADPGDRRPHRSHDRAPRPRRPATAGRPPGPGARVTGCPGGGASGRCSAGRLTPGWAAATDRREGDGLVAVPSEWGAAGFGLIGPDRPWFRSGRAPGGVV